MSFLKKIKKIFKTKSVETKKIETKSVETKKIETKEEEKEECICPVCLDTIDINENNFNILECDHYLHKNCLTKLREWHDKCPLCRKNIIVKGDVKDKYKNIIPPSITNSEEVSWSETPSLDSIREYRDEVYWPQPPYIGSLYRNLYERYHERIEIHHHR